jgi:hypothetical protein
MSVEATTTAPNTPATPPPASAEPAAKAEEKSLKQLKAELRARPAKEAPAAPKTETPSTGETPKPTEAAKPAEKPEDERVARAFRQIQQQKGELDKGRKAFEDEKKAHAQALADAQALKEQAELYKKDPVEWLKKHGGDEAYKRLTDWRLGGDKQPVEEQVKTALDETAAVKKALEEERAARAKEKEELEAAQRKAASDAQLANYKQGFAEHFTAQDRATAKLFGIADLEQAAVEWAGAEYIPALRENGVDGESLESELTQAKIAVKVKEILDKQLGELRANEVLKGIFGGAAKAETATPQPAPKTGTKPAQALSLNNTMSATTDVGLGDLSLSERKRIVHQRSRRR